MPAGCGVAGRPRYSLGFVHGIRLRLASARLACALTLVGAGCAGSGEPARPKIIARQQEEASASTARPAPTARAASPALAQDAIPAEPSLGAHDVGVFSDLDPRVRLALPRRVYTRSHYDHVGRTLERIAKERESVHGYRIVEQSPILRHFRAKLQPVTA